MNNNQDLIKLVKLFESETRTEDLQLDELSKTKLGSYAKKARHDLSAIERDLYDDEYFDSLSDTEKNELIRRADSRGAGIDRAVDKLMKEETALEDILSKKYHDFKDIHPKTKTVEERDGAGISQEDLANVLTNALARKFPDIFLSNTHADIDYATHDVAGEYAGVEEIGTSDLGIMLRRVIDILNETGEAMYENDTPASNPTDKIAVDVPLLIRIMEYAREDATDDMDLHRVAENLVKLSKHGKTLTMNDYEHVVGSMNQDELPDELVELGAPGSAIGDLATQKSQAVAMAPGKPISTTANTSPASTTTSSAATTATASAAKPSMGSTTTQKPLDQAEQQAIDRIKNNAGLKSQYDQLLKKAGQ